MYICIQDCSNVRFFCRSPTLNLFWLNPRPWLQLPGEEGSVRWRFLNPAKTKKEGCKQLWRMEEFGKSIQRCRLFCAHFSKIPEKFFTSCIFGFKQFRLYSKSIPLLVLRSSCPHHLNRSWVTISIEVTFHHSTSEAQKNVSQWNLKSWIWNKVNLNSLKKSPKV